MGYAIACVGCYALGMGFVDTVLNVLLLKLHGENNESYMQGLHLAMSIGASVGPLLVTGSIAHTGEYKSAYIAIGIFCFVSGFPVLCFTQPERKQEDDDEERELSSLESRVTVITAVMFAAYIGLEETFGAFLPQYAVTHKGLNTTERNGQLASAIFWGSHAAGRLVGILLSLCNVSGFLMLRADAIGTIVGSLFLFLHKHGLWTLWATSGFMGFAMGSYFGMILSASELATPLTGRIMEFYTICMAVAALSLSQVFGQLMYHFGALSFVYGIVTLTVIEFLVTELDIFTVRQAVAGNDLKTNLAEEYSQSLRHRSASFVRNIHSMRS